MISGKRWSRLALPVVECPRDTAGKGYTGGEHVITPYKGRDKPPSQKAANRTHAKLRGPGERASAQLKTWLTLEELRRCPSKAGQLAKASTASNTTRSGRCGVTERVHPD